MIIVTGEVRFAAGEIDRLRPAMEANIQTTRSEPGCEAYSYAVDLSDPNRLFVVERWADEDALDRHMRSPHMAEFMAVFGAAKVESAAIHAYQADYVKTVVGAPPT